MIGQPKPIGSTWMDSRANMPASRAERSAGKKGAGKASRKAGKCKRMKPVSPSNTGERSSVADDILSLLDDIA